MTSALYEGSKRDSGHRLSASVRLPRSLDLLFATRKKSRWYVFDHGVLGQTFFSVWPIGSRNLAARFRWRCHCQLIDFGIQTCSMINISTQDLNVWCTWPQTKITAIRNFSKMPQVVAMRYIDQGRLGELLARLFPAYPPSYAVEVGEQHFWMSPRERPKNIWGPVA